LSRTKRKQQQQQWHKLRTFTRGMVKTATNQNGDKSKRRHQNGDIYTILTFSRERYFAANYLAHSQHQC